jgi:hypothetical protein
MNPGKLLAIAMIVLSIAAAVCYGIRGDTRHCIYWAASAILISAVTF